MKPADSEIENFQPEKRNTFGMPTVDADAPHNRGNFHQEVDQSVNKALPWVAFSWLLSGGAIIGLILMSLMIPAYVDSKMAQAVSESRATMAVQVADARIAMAQQVADAKASANTAREHARIALDKVEQTQTQLGAKGLIKPETH